MGRNAATAPARFWAKVAESPDGCWHWNARRMTNGYGYFDKHYAHRWAYEQLRAEIPEGLELDHLCRVRHCVNPWHLEPVTHVENHRRRTGIKTGPYDVGTHCRQGHERSPENTRVNQQGARECKPCRRLATQKCRAKRSNTVPQ